MKALEAKQLADNNSELLSNKEFEVYDKIMAEIKKSLEDKPVYSISMELDLPRRVQGKLEADGYIITHHSYRNESYVEISWEFPRISKSSTTTTQFSNKHV